MGAEDSGKKPKDKQTNKLLGWFVTYQNNNRGSYYELREGRVFIGSGTVEGEKLISLDPKQFQTIHAALQASPSDGVMIQDIFSSTGTFVSRAGSNEEKLAANPIELGHGDWVRVGDVTRFQVCLIDGRSE